MSPVFTILDFAYRFAGNTKAVGNGLVRSFGLKDLHCLNVRQFGAVVLLASLLRSVAELVLHVVEVRIPSQVRKSVVRVVAVVVASLQAFRAWAMKSKQHQTMNVKAGVLAFYAQVSVFATVTVSRKSKDSPGKRSLPSSRGHLNAGAGTHSAKVRHFVEAFKSWHCDPVFHASETRGVERNCKDKLLPSVVA